MLVYLGVGCQFQYWCDKKSSIALTYINLCSAWSACFSVQIFSTDFMLCDFAIVNSSDYHEYVDIISDCLASFCTLRIKISW